VGKYILGIFLAYILYLAGTWALEIIDSIFTWFQELTSGSKTKRLRSGAVFTDGAILWFVPMLIAGTTLWLSKALIPLGVCYAMILYFYRKNSSILEMFVIFLVCTVVSIALLNHHYELSRVHYYRGNGNIAATINLILGLSPMVGASYLSSIMVFEQEGGGSDSASGWAIASLLAIILNFAAVGYFLSQKYDHSWDPRALVTLEEVKQKINEDIERIKNRAPKDHSYLTHLKYISNDSLWLRDLKRFSDQDIKEVIEQATNDSAVDIFHIQFSGLPVKRDFINFHSFDTPLNLHFNGCEELDISWVLDQLKSWPNYQRQMAKINKIIDHNKTVPYSRRKPIPHQPIGTLDLSDTHLSGEHVDALSGLKGIAKLKIKGTDLSDDDVKEIKKKLKGTVTSNSIFTIIDH